MFRELVQTVSQRRRRRFVHDALDGEAREFARFFRGVALRVVEVSRDGNDGARHRFAQKRLGVTLQFPQYFRGNLLRRVTMTVNVHGDRSSALAFDRIRDQPFFPRDLAAAPPDEPLDRINSLRRFERPRAIRRMPDYGRGARRGKMDDRRREALAFSVRDNEWNA